MFTIVFVNKCEDFEESLFEDFLKFLVDFDSFNDVLVTFPNNFKFIFQFLKFLFFIRFKAGKNDGGTSLFTFDVG